jgi:hypothetical protein
MSNAPKRSSQVTLGGILTVMGLIAVIAYFNYQEHRDDRPTQDTSTPATSRPATNAGSSAAILTVAANTIIQDYQDNEIAADQKYKDKRVRVTGIVDQVGKDIMGDMYVTVVAKSSDFHVVQCYFAKPDQTELAALKKRARIIVVGTCGGLMMNVLLNNCTIEGTGTIDK